MATMLHLLKNVQLPKVAHVKCEFDRSEVEDVAAALLKELERPEISCCIKPGMKIAVGVGSRGLASLETMVKTLVKKLQDLGAKPFIVPTMGSHGGATAEGQKAILASLGITEETMGCPIRSSMETVELGTVHIPDLDTDTKTYFDRNAYEADGIVTVARVKVHPAFKDTLESGLCKMLVVGFGKQRGAQAYHTAANGRMGRVLEAVAPHILKNTKVLFAVGSVENAYDRICDIRAVPAKEIVETDKEMLVLAKERIGKLPFNKLDVLIAKQMGKEISGEGLDPNITGKRAIGPVPGGPKITKIGVLQLSKESDGNIVGIGAVDVITEKLYSRVNLAISYANALTTGGLHNVRIPMTLASDEEVIRAAVHSSKVADTTRAHLVIIKDTLHLSDLYISEGLKEAIEADNRLTLCSDFEDLPFSSSGELMINWE